METGAKTTCPTCKANLNYVSLQPNSPPPASGEYTICFNCGEFLVFTEPPQVRLMEFSEEVNMADNLLEVMKAMRTKIVQKKAYKEMMKGFTAF